VKVYLMRHSCVGVKPGVTKPPDIPLDATGRRQAHVMRKFLKVVDVKPDIILSSDLPRAEETAQIMQRGDTPLKTTPWLRPGGDGSASSPEVAGAWNAINALAGDAKSILIVTHGPLIQALLASIAFNFVDERWYYEHGAIAYINTHESRFRWIVTPKLAAHIVGSNPKKVENVVDAARESLKVAENLMAATRQATILPLRNKMRAAVTDRWKRQKRAVLKAMRKHDAPNDLTSTQAVVAQVIPFHDKTFLKKHAAIKGAAFTSGASHAQDQLGVYVGGSVQGIEADPKRPAMVGAVAAGLLPKPNPQTIDSEGNELEGFLDNTTVDRAHTALADLGADFTSSSAIAAIGKLFDEFSDPEPGVLSRADTVGLHTVSDGYHAGGNAMASDAALSNTVEKRWDIGDEGCPICEANSDEGWIDNDEPHGSGDFEPPAHPNCDCSESYRIAETDEE
jgi:phosphohistidine phosphatase SixA